VFDWSMKALVVEVLPEHVVRKEEIDLSYYSEIERIRMLEKIGTAAILCGGISLQLEGLFAVHGIDVISWISGSVDDILNMFLEGTLQPDKHTLPGVSKNRYSRLMQNRQIEKYGRDNNLNEWKDNE